MQLTQLIRSLTRVRIQWRTAGDEMAALIQKDAVLRGQFDYFNALHQALWRVCSA
jgi:hypothetical protein